MPRAAQLPTVAQVYHAAFPLARLVEHPQNPNRGDVARLGASLQHHGFVGVIVAQAAAQPDGRHRVLAGNHRLRALLAAGVTHAAVVTVDLGDQQALQFMLVDNRTAQAAVADDVRLAEVLALLDAADALDGSGFSVDELDALHERLGLDASMDGLDVGAVPAAPPGPAPVTEVRMTLTFARERVTPEVEAAVKDVAVLYGARFAMTGLREAAPAGAQQGH